MRPHYGLKLFRQGYRVYVWLYLLPELYAKLSCRRRLRRRSHRAVDACGKVVVMAFNSQT